VNKFKLEIEYDYDFALIGICSHEKDYRICWALNNKLGFELKKTEELEIKEKKLDEPSMFSMYVYESPEQYIGYYVIANRSENGLLVPEHKQVDYFLMVKGAVTDEQVGALIRQLREVNLVLTAYEIDPNQLKSKQNLLF
jgi:hypothetical protein